MENMESQPNRDVSRVERGQSRVEDLHLDRVVASQPEIGPTPPDGGYGWLIVVSAIVYHITVPAVLSLYGLIILKVIREVDHDENEELRIWDVDIALVPVILVVMRLLLESWCRAMVKIFNMPRLMALAGLCMTVAGVLLSSYSADAVSNDHIVSIFSGIFAGIGCALTGQQTDVIIAHYFRNKLTMAQRLVRMAPSVGNCLIPILVGYLCTLHPPDVAVMIYGAIVMQNCLFLASYTRPVYIEMVLRTTYNMLRAVEDEDEVIFSNQNRNRPNERTERVNEQTTQNNEITNTNQEEDVVVFNSRKNAKEIIDPSIQIRENVTATNNEHRFSSDFSNMFADVPSTSRFSSDFGSLDITSYNQVKYQELQDIDRDNSNPQPLYRETTVDAPQNLVFTPDMTPGTARRTATMKKNLITVWNMLLDINFYLYALLHMCTTFSIMILAVAFPVLVWEQNMSQNIWQVALEVAIAHGAALCFIMLCIVMPKSVNEKARLCAAFCVVGAVGFGGILVSSNKSVLVIFCMCASFATAASSILQQPLYNSTLNEFDTTATMTTSNAIVAIFIMIWSLVYNYTFKTCFLTAGILQILTACVFFLASFRRRR